MQIFECSLKFVGEMTSPEDLANLQDCCLTSVEMCTRNLSCGTNCESAALHMCFVVCVEACASFRGCIGCEHQQVHSNHCVLPIKTA